MRSVAARGPALVCIAAVIASETCDVVVLPTYLAARSRGDGPAGGWSVGGGGWGSEACCKV